MQQCIWTVVEVETGGVTQGFGFRIDRRPQILFERHKFREFTAHRFDSVAPDLSGPPGPYGTLAVQYDRLNQAGFNHDAAGFATASAMVEAMRQGEDAQLAAMAGFLVTNGLVDALSRRDWATFAAGYNGPAYAQNQYDVKLAQQYQRFAGGSLPSLEIRTGQAALLFLGYAPGNVDGILGQHTRSALAFATAPAFHDEHRSEKRRPGRSAKKARVDQDGTVVPLGSSLRVQHGYHRKTAGSNRQPR